MLLRANQKCHSTAAPGVEAALAAGRLTQRLWQGLLEFRDAFAALPADEDEGVAAGQGGS